MRERQPATLALADGTLFSGHAYGAPGTACGEAVFTTGMTGYQEVLTDPSYRGQIVVMTQPHIGNYGVDSEVAESLRPWVEGFVARRFTREPSNHTSEEGLPGYLGRHGIPALDGMGPIGGLDHGPDEYILRGSIVPRTALLARLIMGITGESS